ncbi:hypothetical protein TGRUB_290710 [Toxoplasma gondii RUB]|uniref:Uncharacterized protein n=3 Tax=Toxoplasma gondii TaxID=5811 RepID=V4Z0U6_TOXGV|nr:hypothetical protein TGVEG_290710 [Toxoplasma gondii VEG]KFG62799.1 hypothetical protein TGRUB_290710 [Toxoplasma gondii RUB]KFG99943.1 hypothetical protein TGVAND_290710 [Toxoplasma gondii VAND]
MPSSSSADAQGGNRFECVSNSTSPRRKTRQKTRLLVSSRDAPRCLALAKTSFVSERHPNRMCGAGRAVLAGAKECDSAERGRDETRNEAKAREKERVFLS